jgi:hypothetical protein
MNNKLNDKVNAWIYSEQEMLTSLLADEAKNKAILDNLINTLHQLRAKSSFRLALINQLITKINTNTN